MDRLRHLTREKVAKTGAESAKPQNDFVSCLKPVPRSLVALPEGPAGPPSSLSRS